ncbi:MAG: diguanylate cyclase, partial [Deltaproteobacteria bacterium]|nr:diguanylate cyclase [Deltaproteobacteria bacterium]
DDISTHPYWENYKEAALRAGLSACWSQPIYSSSRQILGTFAIYHRVANKPTDENINLIEQSARLVSIALEKSQAEEELRESKAFVQSILDSVANQIAVINEAGIIISINDAWRKFSIDNSNEPGQMAPNTDVGTNYLEICGGMSETDSEAVTAREGIQAVLEGRLPTYSLEYPCHSPEQQRWFIMIVTPLKTGNKGAVVVHNDITQRKQSEEQIQKLAFYDPLTNLANRRLLLDRMGQALAESKRSGKFCAVMFLDLDNFKSLNDDYGHDMGDVLLIDAAHRLQHCVRETDTVARFGGDEFVVMLTQISAEIEHAESQVRSIAEKIRTTLSAPYQLASDVDDIIINHQCTASIGVTLFNGQEADSDEVIKRADAAMYKAKQSGRNAIEYVIHNAKADGLSETIPENFVQLNWRSAYLSGNPLIDEQHRALIASANQLLTFLLENHPRSEVGAQIDSILRDA